MKQFPTSLYNLTPSAIKGAVGQAWTDHLPADFLSKDGHDIIAEAICASRVAPIVGRHQTQTAFLCSAQGSTDDHERLLCAAVEELHEQIATHLYLSTHTLRGSPYGPVWRLSDAPAQYLRKHFRKTPLAIVNHALSNEMPHSVTNTGISIALGGPDGPHNDVLRVLAFIADDLRDAHTKTLPDAITALYQQNAAAAEAIACGIVLNPALSGKLAERLLNRLPAEMDGVLNLLAGSRHAEQCGLFRGAAMSRRLYDGLSHCVLQQRPNETGTMAVTVSSFSMAVTLLESALQEADLENDPHGPKHVRLARITARLAAFNGDFRDVLPNGAEGSEPKNPFVAIHTSTCENILRHWQRSPHRKHERHIERASIAQLAGCLALEALTPQSRTVQKACLRAVSQVPSTDLLGELFAVGLRHFSHVFSRHDLMLVQKAADSNGGVKPEIALEQFGASILVEAGALTEPNLDHHLVAGISIGRSADTLNARHILDAVANYGGPVREALFSTVNGAEAGVALFKRQPSNIDLLMDLAQYVCSPVALRSLLPFIASNRKTTQAYMHNRHIDFDRKASTLETVGHAGFGRSMNSIFRTLQKDDSLLKHEDEVKSQTRLNDALIDIAKKRILMLSDCEAIQLAKLAGAAGATIFQAAPSSRFKTIATANRSRRTGRPAD